MTDLAHLFNHPELVDDPQSRIAIGEEKADVSKRLEEAREYVIYLEWRQMRLAETFPGVDPIRRSWHGHSDAWY